MVTRATINRRQMLSLIIGSPQIWPSTVSAQERGTLWRIGFLMGYPEDDPEVPANFAAFHEGLKAVGLEEGRNVRIDYRWAGVDPERARTLALELIGLKPDLLVASTNQVVSILMQETRTIPIVFVFIGDPIGSGYAATIARPGANLTGFSNFEAPIGGKWLEMLIEIAPTTKRIGFVYHPAASPHRQFLKAAEASSPSLGLGLTAIPVTAVTEIETLITAFAKAGSDSAIAVAPHALTLGSRQPDYAACGRPPLAGNLRRPAFHAQRRADVLRHQHARPAAPRRGVCGSHPERREARPAAHTAPDHVRHGHQYENCEGPRLDRTPVATCASRRVNRVKSDGSISVVTASAPASPCASPCADGNTRRAAITAISFSELPRRHDRSGRRRSPG